MVGGMMDRTYVLPMPGARLTQDGGWHKGGKGEGHSQGRPQSGRRHGGETWLRPHFVPVLTAGAGEGEAGCYAGPPGREDGPDQGSIRGEPPQA